MRVTVRNRNVWCVCVSSFVPLAVMERVSEIDDFLLRLPFLGVWLLEEDDDDEESPLRLSVGTIVSADDSSRLLSERERGLLSLAGLVVRPLLLLLLLDELLAVSFPLAFGSILWLVQKGGARARQQERKKMEDGR